MYRRIQQPLHLLASRISRHCPRQRIRPFTSRSRRALDDDSSSAAAWKIAIVGSGPSGCYTGKYLLKSDAMANSQIDVLDRLPTPYGLVRNGVAPDHPEVKSVHHDFDSLFMKDGNEDNGQNLLNFYGNVTVGTDISLEELREIYDVVVLAYGCESVRPYDFIQNSKLEGILSAREFVSWYNGHVDYEWVGPLVEKALKRGSGQQQVVVIGHGNVALDCARILAKTREELDPTDIAARSLNIIDQQNRREISVIGRRGHVQAAFTIKEARELTRLDDANFVVRKDELDMGRTEASKQEINAARPRKRMEKLLTDAAAATSAMKNNTDDDDSQKKAAEVHLRFLLNPTSFETKDGSSLSHVTCERTRLVGDAGSQSAEGTGEMETIEAQLALVSIGYKGVAIPGTEEWYDDKRGILKNTHGLIEGSKEDLGGLYVSGWLKRGPSGIIGTNITDAKDTVASILHALKSSSPVDPKEGWKSIDETLKEKGINPVNWDGYRRIDAEERSPSRKRSELQPREKICSREEQLKAAFSS
ncbi:unnamed protein product [Cylindrotheca closterium]|uniref:NADPH:adrenodoxin oxidoreductase, mitochondrial n=1 Tax=Cylindrotheca closterium TaxID=2856 RepID=A0AAD2PUJ7_9STRA|nr:unnamed protein product [Cylindrotheca closterium]